MKSFFKKTPKSPKPERADKVSREPRRKRQSTSEPEAAAPSSARFLPNIRQLQEAIRHLPDPDLWADELFESAIVIDNRRHYLRFKRTSIQRGSKQTFRWVYDGKLLIRNRDVDEINEESASFSV